MARTENLKDNFSHEFIFELSQMTEPEICTFYIYLQRSIGAYIGGYELSRPMYLVLDNSIIQDFKHAGDRRRRPRALAFAAFCRFAAYWSDLPGFLAVTPVALYEHGGRKPTDTPEHATSRITEVISILRPCGLPMAMIGFKDGKSLHQRMRDVHADADYLEVFANQIEQAEWERDLRAVHGGEILAAAMADKAIPDDMPLKYFDPFYIRQVFGSRIEAHIANQSEGIFHEQPIRSGEISAALAKLNTITKKGVLQGLGDIDLLQICDIGRQYRQKADFLLLGQTYDNDLRKVLRFHNRLMVEGTPVIGGSPDVEQQIKDMVKFMFSNPFSEEKKRAERIIAIADDFTDHVASLCRNVVDRRSA